MPSLLRFGFNLAVQDDALFSDEFGTECCCPQEPPAGCSIANCNDSLLLTALSVRYAGGEGGNDVSILLQNISLVKHPPVDPVRWATTGFFDFTYVNNDTGFEGQSQGEMWVGCTEAPAQGWDALGWRWRDWQCNTFVGEAAIADDDTIWFMVFGDGLAGAGGGFSGVPHYFVAVKNSDEQCPHGPFDPPVWRLMGLGSFAELKCLHDPEQEGAGYWEDGFAAIV